MWKSLVVQDKLIAARALLQDSQPYYLWDIWVGGESTDFTIANRIVPEPVLLATGIFARTFEEAILTHVNSRRCKDSFLSSFWPCGLTYKHKPLYDNPIDAKNDFYQVRK